MPTAPSGAAVAATPDGPAGVVLDHWTWEQYDILAADRGLAEEHDEHRGRYSEQRRGLYLAFAELPLLSEGESREAVVAEYASWCEHWGSPGLFGFLFAPAGSFEGCALISEKRSGELLPETLFYERYPEADRTLERYREPVRVGWFSREVYLLRQTLTLAAALQENTHSKEARKAERELRRHLQTVPAPSLSGSAPDHTQGVRQRSGDETLLAWLNLHGQARLWATYDPRTRHHESIWQFDSFMNALYHLLLEDVTGGQRIRRCADPKCRRFFRPKRNSIYHDESCRRRHDSEKDRERSARALKMQQAGGTVAEIAEKLGWDEKKTATKLRKAEAAEQRRRDRRKSKDGQR